MNRRRALESLAVIGSASFAGCSSVLGPGDSRTVLGKVEVINSSFVSNQILLTVERDDETLIERTISLAAIDAEDGAASKIIGPAWSETQARYTIRAIHIGEDGDRESDAREYTFTQEDYDTYYGEKQEDPGCIGAVVKIGSLTDEEKAPIEISPTYMETPCGTQDSQ